MRHQSELKAELVELMYDLLPEDRAVELRARIADDPETAALYEQVKQRASMISDASRLIPKQSFFGAETTASQTFDAKKSTEIPLPDLAESDMRQVAHAGHHRSQLFRLMPWEFAKRALQQERGINRVMSCAAVLLVAITIGAYFYQQHQMSQVSAIPLRVVAAAPDRLVKGAPQSLLVQVTDLFGQEQQVPVQVSLNTEQGTELAALVEQTDAEGNLLVPLSQLTEQIDAESHATLQLAVSAGRQPLQKYVATLNLTEKPPERQVDDQTMLAINSTLSDVVNQTNVANQINAVNQANTANQAVSDRSRNQIHHYSLSQQQFYSPQNPRAVTQSFVQKEYQESVRADIVIPAETAPASEAASEIPDRSIPRPLASMAAPREVPSGAVGGSQEVASRSSLSARGTQREGFRDSGTGSKPAVSDQAASDQTPLSRVEPNRAAPGGVATFGVLPDTSQVRRVAPVPATNQPGPLQTQPLAQDAFRESQAREESDSPDSESSGYIGAHFAAGARSSSSGNNMSTSVGMSGSVTSADATGGDVSSDGGMGGMSVAPMSDFAKNRHLSPMGVEQQQARGMAANRYAQSLIPQAAPLAFNTASSDAPEISLISEGGQLVNGVQNRVFFRATVAEEPIQQLTGHVSDEQGRKIAELECDVDGYGQFYLEPQQGQRNKLVVSQWAGPSQQSSNMAPLEMTMRLHESQSPVGMGVAKHVITPDEAVTVHLRSRESDVPVVVTVSQNDVPLISRPTVTEAGVKSLRLPIPPKVTGLLEVAVFDSREESREPVGTEQVLRRPTNWLAIHAEAIAQTKKSTDSEIVAGTKTKEEAEIFASESDGHTIDDNHVYYSVQLRVTDAEGRAVPNAEISVRVMQGLWPEPLADRFFAAVPSETGLRYLLPNEEFSDQLNHWETLDALLTSRDAKSVRELEYLVATGDLTLGAMVGGKPYSMPKVIDNLSLLQVDYQQEIAGFQQSQRSRGIVIGIVVVFGGMALAVLSMILVIMRLASGSRMFVVATVAGLSCVFVCMVMLRGQSSETVVTLKQPAYASTDTQFSETLQTTDSAQIAIPTQTTGNTQSPKSTATNSTGSPSFVANESEQIAACAPVEKLPDVVTSLSEPSNDAVPSSGTASYAAPMLANDQLVEAGTAFPIRLVYENSSLRTDADGKVRFDVPVTAVVPGTEKLGNVPPTLYQIVDVRAQDGQSGIFRTHFNKILKPED